MVLGWQPAGTNRGPQGIQGVPGPAGSIGPAGPSGVTTLRGATDYDNTTAPVVGEAMIWVSVGGGKYAPRPVMQLAGDLGGTLALPTVKTGAGFFPRTDANDRIASGRMPLVSSGIRVGNVTTNVTSDASTTAGNLLNINANGNITVDAPTNPTDFQTLRYHIVANGAARTVTFGAGILPAKNLPTGLGPYALLQGDVLTAVLEYVGNHQTVGGVASPAWALLAAAIV